jgi:hypothetical protein
MIERIRLYDENDYEALINMTEEERIERALNYRKEILGIK